jgi:hypothetical protein
MKLQSQFILTSNISYHPLDNLQEICFEVLNFYNYILFLSLARSILTELKILAQLDQTSYRNWVRQSTAEETSRQARRKLFFIHHCIHKEGYKIVVAATLNH